MKSITPNSVEKLLKDYIHNDGAKYINKEDYEAVQDLLFNNYEKCGVELKGIPGHEYLSLYRITSRTIKEVYKIGLR